MLYEIVNRFPEDMITHMNGPLISIYQPTNKTLPDKKHDSIVFKNLLHEIEHSLEKIPNFDMKDSIMKPLKEIKDDVMFWNYTSEGIAVFASVDKCIVYKLRAPVQELAVVADSFHIKPMLKVQQFTEKYLLLRLSRENFALYKGNRYGFEEVEIDSSKPRTLKDVLGSQYTDSHLSHGSYAGGGGQTMYHGQNDVQQEIDKDTDKYFRYVDKLVYDDYSAENKMPLILATLKEYHSKFRTISSNPHLIEKGIVQSFDSLDLNEMQKQAKNIIMSIHEEEVREIIETFSNAKAVSLGSSDLNDITKAAFENRVDKLLISEAKILPGKIDLNTGEINYGNIDSPDNDDVLDDLAELVLSKGGSVLVLDEVQIPSDTGVAAFYRYK